VERPPETSRKDIEAFMRRLDALEFDEAQGLKIEFWGGEPLVYIKTLRPLVEAINERFKEWQTKPRYSIITNGSLMTEEIASWLIGNCFEIAISHDGPGQHVRGPDPLQEPETRKAILGLYRALRPLGRISFNAMLNRANTSRKAIHDFFIEFTGDPNVILGEGSVVDAYDEGGYGSSLETKAEHFAFRREAFNDIFSTGGNIGFYGVIQKIDSFTRSVLSHREARVLGQKCGMDDPHVLAIDLRGNVLTCQNVSAVETAPNGSSHCAGNIDDMDQVRVHSATHWRNRPHCSGCPVLQLCKGSCMFLEGDYWNASCANSYSDNIVLFALSFERMTGFIPVYIDAPDLPPERRDIWGNLLQHVETPRRRMIPIKAV
jgi:uncharacterized protein